MVKAPAAASPSFAVGALAQAPDDLVQRAPHRVPARSATQQTRSLRCDFLPPQFEISYFVILTKASKRLLQPLADCLFRHRFGADVEFLAAAVAFCFHQQAGMPNHYADEGISDTELRFMNFNSPQGGGSDEFAFNCLALLKSCCASSCFPRSRLTRPRKEW